MSRKWTPPMAGVGGANFWGGHRPGDKAGTVWAAEELDGLGRLPCGWFSWGPAQVLEVRPSRLGRERESRVRGGEEGGGGSHPTQGLAPEPGRPLPPHTPHSRERGPRRAGVQHGRLPLQDLRRRRLRCPGLCNYVFSAHRLGLGTSTCSSAAACWAGLHHPHRPQISGARAGGLRGSVPHQRSGGERSRGAEGPGSEETAGVGGWRGGGRTRGST